MISEHSAHLAPLSVDFHTIIIIIINIFCRLPKYMKRYTKDPIFKYIVYTMIMKNCKKKREKGTCGKYTRKACNVPLLTAFNKKKSRVCDFIYNSILQRVSHGLKKLGVNS